MKEYEAQETDRKFLPLLPLYARIDGRGFSRFTKGMERPFDKRMTLAMIDTTKKLVEKTHATIGYVQSDEISLVWIPTESGSCWFDRKITKMTSVSAALATVSFIEAIRDRFYDTWQDLLMRSPHFDSRVIVMPSITEAANMILWRNLDATKNAISMAAHHYYSHKELQNKSGAEKQEMLFQKGINFNDYPYFFKRGSFVRRQNITRTLTEKELEAIPVKHRPDPTDLITRTHVIDFDLPPLNKITNRIEVLFESSAPILRVD